MIIDTSALSAFFDGDSSVRALVAKAVRISLPVIVLGEYRFGLLGSRLRKVIEPVLDGFQAAAEVLVIDAETARPYAKLRDQLKRTGRPMPLNDVWIAALALQHGLPIMSRDVHFDSVPGISRVGW